MCKWDNVFKKNFGASRYAYQRKSFTSPDNVGMPKPRTCKCCDQLLAVLDFLNVAAVTGSLFIVVLHDELPLCPVCCWPVATSALAYL